jgi:hypothetical protein
VSRPANANVTRDNEPSAWGVPWPMTAEQLKNVQYARALIYNRLSKFSLLITLVTSHFRPVTDQSRTRNGWYHLNSVRHRTRKSHQRTKTGSKSDTASIRKCDKSPFFNFLLKALFAKIILGNCRVHSMEYMCKILSQIGSEMSKIFDLGERGVRQVVSHGKWTVPMIGTCVKTLTRAWKLKALKVT